MIEREGNCLSYAPFSVHLMHCFWHIYCIGHTYCICFDKLSEFGPFDFVRVAYRINPHYAFKLLVKINAVF